MKNKYIGRSKLSEAKFRELLKCFCLDLDAGQIAVLIRVNRNKVNRYLRLIRERIGALSGQESPFGGRAEFDSLFGASRFLLGQPPRKSVKRGVPVFAAMASNGNVFTEILPRFLLPFLLPVIRGKAPLASALEDPFRLRGYHCIMHLGCRMPFYLDPALNSYGAGGGNCASLERFLFFIKRRIRKFQGLPRSTFEIHLKECEFRFNRREGHMYSQLLRKFRESPLVQTPRTSGKGGMQERVARSVGWPQPAYGSLLRNTRTSVLRDVHEGSRHKTAS